MGCSAMSGPSRLYERRVQKGSVRRNRSSKDVAIVPGISRHKKGWQDVEDACRMLGYEPQDGTAFPRALG